MDLIRVLVIDGDIDTTDMLKMVLDPDEFEVIATDSSKEGIELINQKNPDIIILDQIMPMMRSREVCKAVRKINQVPILVLSVVNKPDTIARSLDAGADDYLVKPFTNGVLVAHLHKLIRRSRTEISINEVNNHSL